MTITTESKTPFDATSLACICAHLTSEEIQIFSKTSKEIHSLALEVLQTRNALQTVFLARLTPQSAADLETAKIREIFSTILKQEGDPPKAVVDGLLKFFDQNEALKSLCNIFQ